MKTEDIIRSAIPLDELLAGLAEEAAELAQAALKYRRALTGINPTPVSAEDARAALLEELVDVEMYINMIGVHRNREDISVLLHLTLAKRERWAERMRGMGENNKE
jgi:NTP pyrophosphatase (non-canonical NTP hydrolase)